MHPHCRVVPVLFPAVLTAIGLLAGLLVGCQRHGLSAPTGGSDVPPSKVNLKRNVELGTAQQRGLVYHVETVGVLEAEWQTPIAAGVSGIVDDVRFREGDLVNPSSVMVLVDQRRYSSAAKVAEANLVRAENTQKIADDQYRRLVQSGLGASAEDKARAALNKAVSEAEVQSARAALEMARNNLDRSQVRAPYAARVNQRNVTPGMFVEDKTVVATIADLGRLRLVGYIPETAAPAVRMLMGQQEARLAMIRAGLPYAGCFAPTGPLATAANMQLLIRDQVPSGFDPEFTLLAFPRQTFRGRIFYLSTVASPDTHMFEFKAEMDVRWLDRTLIELRPGYTARIRIPLQSNSTACVVPEEAVRASESGFIAFVPVPVAGADGQTEWVAKKRAVELGYRSPGWVEVRQGLAPGDRIIRRGAEALEDGTPIRFADEPQTARTDAP